MKDTQKIVILEHLLKRLYKDDGHGKKRTLGPKQYLDIYDQYINTDTGDEQSAEVEELLDNVCAALC